MGRIVNQGATSAGRTRFLQLSTPIVGTLLAAPLLGLLLTDPGRSTAPADLGFRGGEAFVSTLAWSIGVAVIAWSLGARAITRGRIGGGVALLSLVGLLVPASLWFDAWWLEVGPSSWIGRSAAEGQWVAGLRRIVLLLGLLGVTVPLTIWIRMGRGRSAHDSLRLQDRPRGLRRWTEPLRERWRSELGIVALLTVFIAGLTIPFDLAQVGSIGFELRSLDVRGASPATILRAGWPMVLLGTLGAALVTWALPVRVRRSTDVPRDGGPVGAIVVFALVMLPAMLLIRRALGADVERSLALHLPAMQGSLLVALVGAVFGSVVAACVGSWSLAGRGGRRIARGIVFLSVLCALLPATIFAVGLESLWNRSATSILYDGPFAVMTGVAARIAVAPALVGWIVAMRGPQSPLAVDHPRRMRDFLRSTRPTLARSIVAGGLLGGALSLGEIPVSSRLQPPGFPVLNTALLNAMHYQYVDSVLPAVLLLLAVVVLTAGVLVLWTGRWSRGLGGCRPLGIALTTTLAAIAIPGCEDSDASGGIRPIDQRTTFGRPGNIDGRFDYPRAVAVDGERGRIFVVDKSARIQRFDLEGGLETSWRMPAFANGKPTGLNVAPDGRVLVADTHEHRVTIFSPEGELLSTHGTLGEGPGEFIYPTDVVAGPDDTWFVSEYGGNDRVQIFDRDWRPIGVIGFAGEEDLEGRPALARPQSMVWDSRRDELLIADAVHHRIVVTNASGELLRTFGGPGREVGRLSYPYDLALLEDGSLMVVEYGNNRIQRFDPVSGRGTDVWGGEGVDAGRVRYPWGLDAADGSVIVLDSGNSRVIVGNAP